MPWVPVSAFGTLNRKEFVEECAPMDVEFTTWLLVVEEGMVIGAIHLGP